MVTRVLTRRFFSLAACVTMGGALFAADEKKPDLSGEWTMNPAKSDYGRLPKPAKFLRKIVHAEPAITLTSTFGTPQGTEVVTEFKYTTDGKEASNTVRGTEVKSTAKWDGTTLQINSKRPTPGGGEITTVERWTVSEDGKSMLVHTTITAPQGETKTLVFFEKQ